MVEFEETPEKLTLQGKTSKAQKIVVSLKEILRHMKVALSKM
jgi:hypothetical protein